MSGFVMALGGLAGRGVDTDAAVRAWVGLPSWWPEWLPAWASSADVLCSLVLVGVAALPFVVPTGRNAWRAQAAQWRRFRRGRTSACRHPGVSPGVVRVRKCPDGGHGQNGRSRA